MILFRIILRAHIGPFLFSFFTLMFIFLLQFIMRFIDQLVGKGLGGWVIAELIAMNLAWMVVLAVPMSVLVATLMAYGNLSSANEITAMKASGTSVIQLMLPSAIAATFLAVFLVYFNNEILPDANHRAKSLIIDIRRKKPTLTIQSGVFCKDISGYSILAGKTFEKTNELLDVKIYDYNNPESEIILTAKKGNVSFSIDYQNLIMDLTDGEIHELNVSDFQTYRRIKFQHHRIAMFVEGLMFERSAEGTFERSDRELSASDMQHSVDSLEKMNTEIRSSMQMKIREHFSKLLSGNFESHQQKMNNSYGPFSRSALNTQFFFGTISNDISRIAYYQNQIDEFLVEIHKKYSIPFACIVFALIGAPLGMMVRRGGFGIAATLSLGFFLLYWSFLVGGEKFADRNIISPFVGMWSANILLTALSVFLIRKSQHHALFSPKKIFSKRHSVSQ
jgi:lipopolysaccharide export system permease protein